MKTITSEMKPLNPGRPIDARPAIMKAPAPQPMRDARPFSTRMSRVWGPLVDGPDDCEEEGPS